jgi:ribonuclease R
MSLRNPGKAKPAEQQLPSEAELLDYVRSRPGKVNKRDVARAFGIRSAPQKLALKRMLRHMADEGLLERRTRKFLDPSKLPPVAPLLVTGIDDDGELVAQPLEWDEDAQGPAPRILVEARRAAGTGEDRQPPRTGDRILARLAETGDTAYPYSAQVLRRLEAGTRVLGVLRAGPGDTLRVIPTDKKARNEYELSAADAGGGVPGELVAVELAGDPRRGVARAKVTERFGSVSDQRNIALIAIHQHGIPDKFPREVIDEAERAKKAPIKGRVDLRKVPLITIDPPDARDHDDAVWAAPDDDPANEGGVRVIVAIADVAHYIRPGGALDKEARIRGNSVYFPDRVVPMLPERISNDLCSLKENEDRPGLACSMIFDKSGRKRSHKFERVMMRSAASLSYEQAQSAIDGRPDEAAGPLLANVLEPLWQAYGVLMKGRRKREPLELDIPERKLILDAHGMIERVVTPERLDAHKLVEEFMIQANVAAAETLESEHSPLIYRVHEAPAPEKIVSLADFLKTIGISAPKGQVMKPVHFNRILAQAAGKEYQHLVNEVVLRSQSQAVYSPENRGHFGLNLRRYAHFTSPIRRYADLIVHRALVSVHKWGGDGLSEWDMQNLAETAELISASERRAMAAERETVDRLVAAHLSEQTGTVFEARISGATRAGLFVALNESGADGFVPISSLGKDYFVYDEARRSLIGERSGETFRLGDPVRVKLVEATPVAGGMRFEMVSSGTPGKASPGRSAGSRHKHPYRRRGRR